MFNQNAKPDLERRFFGNYRGVVIRDDDPRKCARVKVRVYGFYDDVQEEAIPWALYSDPFMGGQGGIGGVFVPDVGSEVWVFFENGDHMQPVYFAGAPSAVAFPNQITKTDQPEQRGKIKYPRNKAISTSGGHVIELDDTEGNSRVRISHKSGSQIIMYDNGDVYERVAGNLTRVVFGNLTEYVKGDKTTHTVGNLDLRASMIDLNKEGATFDVSEAEQRSLTNALPLIRLTGTGGIIDEPEEYNLLPSLIEQGFPPPSSIETSGEASEIKTGSSDATVEEVTAEKYGSIDYNMELACGIKLREVTIATVFPHSIKAQVGLSTDDIINNLKALAVNILCPLREKYGKSFNINSGFRLGNGGSQHNKGQAVDIQFPAFNGKEGRYDEVVTWIAENLPFDQFILEHGNSLWLHISFDRNKGKNQRGKKNTWHPKLAPNYPSGFTNYYAKNGK